MFSGDSEHSRAGRLQVIKTRDYMIIEAYVPFTVSMPSDITLSVSYEFPETGLLCGAACDQMSKLKFIFGKAKQELLTMEFRP